MRTAWGSILLLATTFGILEAAVVVYLRATLDPGGDRFPYLEIPTTLLRVEIPRELATLGLLAAAARLAARSRAARGAAFLVLFGTWDLVYYAALRAWIGWPLSLAQWDLLFLVPVPWYAPVYAPVLVASTMVVTGALILLHEARRGPFEVTRRSVVAAGCGAVAILASFIAPSASGTGPPERYPIEWLVLGEIAGLAGFVGAWRSQRPQPVAEAVTPISKPS